MTGDDSVYVAEYISRDATEQVRAARLNKSLVSQEDVQVRAGNADTNIGHRGPAIGVDSSGNVVISDDPDGTWSVKHTTTVNNLSTLTATTRPTAIGATDVLTKSRIFYDSFTDKLFMLIEDESAGSQLTLFEYDSANNTWSNVGNDPLTTGGIDKYTHSGMAFGDGVMYLTYSTNIAGDGYESAHIQIIKSTDGGANWTDLLGNAVTLPADFDTDGVHTQVNPEARDGTVPESTERPNLVLDSNNNPVIVAPWRDMLGEASNMTWWLFRWNTTAETFVRHELVSTGEDVFSGYFNLLRGTGSQIIFVYLDPDDDILKVLATTDDGDTWQRWILDDVSDNPAAVSGDQRAPAVDGVYRLITIRHTDSNLDSDTAGATSASTIYEFTLPVATSGTRRSAPTIDSIQAKEITSTSAIVTWHTSAPSETRLVGKGAPDPDPTPKTTHEVSVTNLSPDTLYRYTIHAKKPGSSAESTASLGLKTLAAAPPSSSSETPEQAQESATTSEEQEVTELLERIKELQLLLIQVAEQLVEALQEQIQAATVPPAL